LTNFNIHVFNLPLFFVGRMVGVSGFCDLA
jgi:hypothetical protein